MGERENGPRIFLNTVPKSGTNLLLQILKGMPGIQYSGRFFYTGETRDFTDYFLSFARMLPGQMHAGHIHYSQEWALMVQKLQVRTIFLIRDLRDVLVSLAYYIVGSLPHYPIYRDLAALKSNKERLLLLIQGVRDYPNIRDWFHLFGEWRNEANALVVTYEQLMSSPVSRRQTLRHIAEYVWQDHVPPVSMKQMATFMEKSIDPGTSVTFRKGIVGGWKDEFDLEVKEEFKRIAGDLLIEMGYEQDLRW